MRNPGVQVDPDKFSPMPYNPFRVPEGAYFIQYYDDLVKNRGLYTPPLATPGSPHYESWDFDLIDQLAKIVVSVLDQDSPLSDSEDMDYRLSSAVLSLGITDHTVRREVEKRGGFFRKMVYEYFRMSRNYDLEQWWSLKTLYHAFASRTQNPSPDLNKDQVTALLTMANAMDDLKKQISRISFRLFKDRESERIFTAERMEDTLAGEPEIRATDIDPDMRSYDLDVFN